MMQILILHHSAPIVMARGKAYNITKIMALYDSGLKPADIASRMKIRSVQSLRHAIERQIRERDEKERIMAAIVSEKESRQRMEQEKQQLEARQRENEQRRNLRAKLVPLDAGLFSYSIDEKTFNALDYVLNRIWGDACFIDSKEKEIYITDDVDLQDVRYELLMSGFYMEVTDKPHEHEMPLKVAIMHSSLMSEIPFDKQIVDIFVPTINKKAFNDIRRSLKVPITWGVMKIENLGRISFSERFNLDYVRGKIRNLRYRGRIRYNPIGIYHEAGKKVLGRMGDSIFTMDNLGDDKIREGIIDAWESLGTKVFMNAQLKEYASNRELSLKEAIMPFLDDVLEITLERIEFRSSIVYPEFSGFEEIPEFNKDQYMDALWSLEYDTISDYYIQMHEKRIESESSDS